MMVRLLHLMQQRLYQMWWSSTNQYIAL